MKNFIIGLIVGSLAFGAVALYVYMDSKAKLNSATARIGQLEKTKTTQNGNRSDIPTKDISTLAAELRNRRLESLSAAKGDEFDRTYLQIVTTINTEIPMFAIDAKKRASAPEVRVLADRQSTDSANLQRELDPLRRRFSLID